MSVSLLRTVCTTALATLTAVTVITAVPGDAEAAPAPPAAAPAPPGPGDSVNPGSDPVTAPARVADLLTRLQTLYRQAEDAGETHTAAESRLKAQRAKTARLGRELTAARDALGEGRREAGRLAREQYQGHSELSAHLRLLLAPNARRALDERHLMERAAAHRMATVARLDSGARTARRLAAASRKALDRERALAAARKKARDTADARLGEIEKMLASLTPEQIAALTTPQAQESLIGSGALGAPAASASTGSAPAGSPSAGNGSSTGNGPSGKGFTGKGSAGARTPTRQGADAVRYAVEQIGKPYVWGATGPESYDCSGLTSVAWAAAGREIPRTSQEQWRELPRVPVRSLRPGDLVVYFPEATHVAIYLGDGMVVQAPRPGTVVKVSPLTANPVLGAVRPDPEGSPLTAYAPPPLPEGATAGSDTGYAETAAPDTETESTGDTHMDTGAGADASTDMDTGTDTDTAGDAAGETGSG
ncbi:C40 family peptidase [Streptomyces sp. NPDC051018]|uniref:C40 family peptidase n=1 Tax=Streptomyces sp. NPDC051018 TaxID=3365639 RepID=UPI0037A0D502